MKPFKAHTVVISLVGVLTLGTVFFRIVEGWSWLDSYFFTVVTVSTVGYGSLVPATALGKIGTTVFIFVGLGVFAVAIQQFALYHMRKREEHTEWLIGRLGHTAGDRPAAANEDDQPGADQNGKSSSSRS
ncbi:potassium channel family protein [Sedimentitalea arenosa]|uniref:Two pore domain potassium channel family protein n=1 Tax=Sedimentitalea arenosa TaxID=2798803 RepID=A0A8J7LVY4_9RHOB|nr:potassium channel family protein [Arenibacterium arenosum]MBJ6371580.1 two pore domain potassium channel family protein [Arenibacterium arenosum]